MKTSVLFLILAMLCGSVVQAAPDSFIYEGYLTDNGAAVNGSANLLVEIKIPSTTCVVYQKSYSGVSVTNGYFSIRIDNNPTLWWDSSNGASSSKFRQIFQAGNFPPGGLCPSGGSAGSVAERQMYVTYQSGSNPVFGPISLESVPFATIAAEAEVAKGLNPSTTVDFNAQKITNLALPTVASDAATKEYVDTVAANASNLSNGTIPSGRLPFATSGALGGVQAGSNISINGSGVISITNTNVTTALGYTPLNIAGGTMTGYLGLYGVAADPSCSAGNAGHIWFNAVGNVVKYCDGATVQTVGAGGAGISSLNGATIATQTYASGASGTAPNWNTNTGTGVHTLNIPLAATAGVTAGLVSKADWDTFNAKLSSVAGAPLGSGTIWVGNGSNQAQSRAMSGDATLSNAGALTIAADAVTSAKIGDGTIASADIANGALAANTAKFFTNPGPDRILMTDSGTGSTIAPFSCTVGESLIWNATQGWDCYTPASGTDSTKLPLAGGTMTGPLAMTSTSAFLNLNYAGSTGNPQIRFQGVNTAIYGDSSSMTLKVDGANKIAMNASLTQILNDLEVNSYYNPGTYSPSGSTNVPNGFSIKATNSYAADDKATIHIFHTKNAGNNDQHAYMGAVSTSAGYNPHIVFGQQTAAAAYTERMRIAMNGNVGIGTTNPGNPLHISSASATVVRVEGNAGTATALDLISNSSARSFSLKTHGSGSVNPGNFSITDLTAGMDRLAIAASGAVGIGTSSPNYKLEVSGDLLVTGRQLASFAGAPITVQNYVGTGSAFPHGNKAVTMWRPATAAASTLNCIADGVPGQTLKIIYKANGSYNLSINHNATSCAAGEARIFTYDGASPTSSGYGATLDLVYMTAAASGYAVNGWVIVGSQGLY